MKSLLTSVILVCAMAATSFATAASFTVKESKKNVFKVQYVSEQRGTVQVTILDNKNEVVFTESITSNGTFVRPYNFSNLAEGEYTIVLKDENGEHRQTINYSTSKVNAFAHVTAVPNQADKFWLNIVTNGEQKMNVSIYSLTGELLHEQSVVVAGTFSKIFDVRLLNQTSVVFEVSNGNGVVYTSLFD